MANYSTNLKTWGGTGEVFPDGYSYVEGEQPVDAWDNFVNYNLISDVSDHLIPLTNSRIETDKGASGNEPTSPETSHLYSDEGNEVLRRWNDTASVWRNIATEYWVNNSADVPNADYADDAGLYKGNDIDSNGDGKVDASDTTDQLSDPTVHDASEFSGADGSSGQFLSTDGTNASWSAAPTEWTEIARFEDNDGSTVVDESISVSGYDEYRIRLRYEEREQYATGFYVQINNYTGNGNEYNRVTVETSGVNSFNDTNGWNFEGYQSGGTANIFLKQETYTDYSGTTYDKTVFSANHTLFDYTERSNLFGEVEGISSIDSLQFHSDGYNAVAKAIVEGRNW